MFWKKWNSDFPNLLLCFNSFMQNKSWKIETDKMSRNLYDISMCGVYGKFVKWFVFYVGLCTYDQLHIYGAIKEMSFAF